MHLSLKFALLSALRACGRPYAEVLLARRNRWRSSGPACCVLRARAEPRPSTSALWLLFSLLWALGPGHAVAQPSQVRELSLRVGDQTTLPAQGVKSYSEGAPGIVEVRLPRDGEQFVLVALRPGSTTLLLFMFDGRDAEVRVTVTPRETELPQRGVPAEDNVRLDLYFVQVSEGHGHQLGVAYPDSIGGSARLSSSFDLASGSLSEASLGIADQVLPRLDLAERAGWARISRKASVVAQNGKQALFKSGGELNVPIQGALTAEVRSIRFGSEVKVAPRFDAATGRIELEVGAEISDLSDDGGSSIPGRNISTLNTVINLDLGKSIVLAGLSSESETRSARGLPWLSRIPVLGALFGTRSFRSERVRNYLVIVPSVVQGVSRQDQNLVEELLDLYRNFEGHLPPLTSAEPTPKTAPMAGKTSGKTR